MVLLYFTDSLRYSGGIQRMLTSKINYLAKENDYIIHLICFEKCQSFFSVDNRVHIHSLNIENKSLSVVEKILSIPRIIKRTKSLIKTIKPDIIINENMKIMSFLLPFFIKRIPLIYVIHFSYEGLMQLSHSIYKNKIIRKHITSIRKSILKKYSYFVVLTEEDKRKWNLPNCMVIPNFTCINNSTQSTLTSKTAIFVGRFSPEKDLETLIKAWKIVSVTEPEWKLNLYGDGIEKNKIKSLIQELRLEESISLKGKSSNIEDVYKTASLLVLTSKFEGFVLVVLEALTMGVPCITFNISGCNNMIKNGVNGFLVKEHSHTAMANQIIKYIQSSTKEKHAMQQNIPETINRYSKDIVMQQWKNLFSSLLYKKN